MKKIAFIETYFNEFPNYFPLHLLTIKYNPTIDWHLFTDIRKKYDYPENVHIHYMSFDELKKLFQSKFDFKLGLNYPYKIADFQPTLGYVFSEYIKNYDFWGHCELDVLLGDLRKYLTDERLEENDVLYQEGLLRLYRNTSEVNTLFKKDLGIFYYKEVYSSSEIYAFTEAHSFQRIVENSGVRYFINDDEIADIEPFCKPLYLREVRKKKFKRQIGIFRSIPNYKYQLFLWCKGKLFRIYLDNDKICKDEFMCMHLLKRKMKYNQNDNFTDTIVVTPDEFIPISKIDIENPEIIKKFSNGDYISNTNESKTTKIKRKVGKIKKMSSSQISITLRQRLYFIVEKVRIRHKK